MARCIEKYDFLPLLHHLVCADMLGDTARFLRSDMGLANRVKKRSLTMVDVAHDGHDR